MGEVHRQRTFIGTDIPISQDIDANDEFVNECPK